LFVTLLKKLMFNRRKAVHLIVDGLRVHKKAVVKKYVVSTQGKLSLYLLPGYAPDLNPDELVWGHVKRTGVARRPLQKGETRGTRIHEQLAQIRRSPDLVRSLFRYPSVTYISDLRLIEVYGAAHNVTLLWIFINYRTSTCDSLSYSTR
jgi:transposase